ncbi:pilus assembly protein [Paenibacillus roseipurpureus]|uniref:Pilus assembly protein n=1 Tax=Paenibacillus roseopurpureus TaxID=2918901 RepID=A0AA96LNX7_9BACL|nr:pilus assembly protein [Paenibacillus sp. MBLB1832]WNR42250.1 pilus assembly protein [Paenibacillus sp. MBLB1832]
MFRKLIQGQEGGIVLEAALLLPLFLAFVLGLIVCIQLAIIEMAMQSGVSEATKSIAGQLYPVRLLVQEAKSTYDQSSAAKMLNGAVDRVQDVRSRVTSAEDFAEQYEAYIPDSVLALVQWEKEKRKLGEGLAQEELDNLYETQVKPRLLAAFTPIVFAFCHGSAIDQRHFQVTDVTLPSMEQGGVAYFGVEAQMTYKLPIPFMSLVIVVKKRAYERAWVGA